MNVWGLSEKFEGEERTKGALSGTFVRWGKEIKPVGEGQGYEKKKSVWRKGEGSARFAAQELFVLKNNA